MQIESAIENIKLYEKIKEEEKQHLRRDNFKVFTYENEVEKLVSQEKGEPMIYNGRKLTKRKDGRWQYRITINHKRICIYGATQKDCLTKIKRFEKKGVNAVKVTNCQDIVTRWYTTVKEPNLKPKSKETYKNTLKNYICPFLNEKNINKIQLYDLQKFLNEIPKERIREQVYQHIKGIFKYATACGELKNNIAEVLILPKRHNKITRESLTIKEQEQLLALIKGTELEPFILFSLVIGTRRNETLAFQLSDINVEKQTLKIKGTKTDCANRTIKISKAMIEYLYINKKSEPYFPYGSEYYTKKIKFILAQINPNLCLHSLRHTCATNLYYLKVPDKQRQQILGHKSIVTTNNVYTNLELDVGKNEVLKLYNNLYYEF